MKFYSLFLLLIFIFFGKNFPTLYCGTASITENVTPNSINEATTVKQINKHNPSLESSIQDATAQLSPQKSDITNTLEEENAKDTLFDLLLKIAEDEGLSWEEFMLVDLDPEDKYSDGGPTFFEASIQVHDPSKQTISDQESALDELLDAFLLTSSLKDIELDDEQLKVLIDDWISYVDFLSKEFLNNMDGTEKSNLLTNVFDQLDSEIKTALLERGIKDIDAFMTKAKQNQIDQSLLLKAIDSLTINLEDIIFSSLKDSELMDKFLATMNEVYPIDLFVTFDTPETSETEINDINEQVNNDSQILNSLNDSSEPQSIHPDSKSELVSSESKTKNNLKNPSEPSNYSNTCHHFDGDQTNCEKQTQCTYNKDSQCTVSSDHMENLIETGCKKESIPNLLSVARDLQQEGHINESTMADMNKKQDIDELCSTVSQAYSSSQNDSAKNSESNIEN